MKYKKLNKSVSEKVSMWIPKEKTPYKKLKIS